MGYFYVSWTMQWDCDILHMIWAYCIENSVSDPCKGERNGHSSYLRVGANLSERFSRSEAPPCEAYTREGSDVRGYRGGLTDSLALENILGKRRHPPSEGLERSGWLHRA
jgi:hypothetical protein